MGTQFPVNFGSSKQRRKGNANSNPVLLCDWWRFDWIGFKQTNKDVHGEDGEEGKYSQFAVGRIGSHQFLLPFTQGPKRAFR